MGKMLLRDMLFEEQEDNQLDNTNSFLEDTLDGQNYQGIVKDSNHRVKNMLENSFFMAKLDKKELEDTILEGSPGLESVKFDLSNCEAGLLANGHVDTDGIISKFISCHKGLTRKYYDTKEYQVGVITRALANGNIVTDDTMSARAWLFKSDLIEQCLNNFVNYYGSESNVDIKPIKIPDNFKLSKPADIKNLVPISISSISSNYIDVECAPLENYKGDSNNLVKITLEMINDKPWTIEEAKECFNRTVKVCEFINKTLDPYLSKFTTYIKRLGSKDISKLLKQTASAGGQAFGIVGAITGGVSGLAAGALLGILGGPIGIILGTVIGGAAGAAIGAINGFINGTVLGLGTGLAITPVVLGIKATLFNTRHKTLDKSTSDNIDLFDDVEGLRDEIKIQLGIKGKKQK